MPNYTTEQVAEFLEIYREFHQALWQYRWSECSNEVENSVRAKTVQLLIQLPRDITELLPGFVSTLRDLEESELIELAEYV
ncbi:hypothetical protein HYT57_04375 [Candidatus Woesearchaeota archaeon]|nr:hypothetical protein [Candidatus Woesearchaeota archaeon]